MTTTAPRVPFTPEPIEHLRARYSAAVADVVDQRAIADGHTTAPSGDPAHVFDTQLGLRLIISRDRWPDGRIGIHVSASWNRELPPTAKFESLFAEINATWQAISVTSRRLEFVAVSEGGIPHFFVEQAQ